MKKKLGVCVPYRNREENLKIFVPEVSKYLKQNGIDHTIYIANQLDDNLFNRGLMKNIAAKYAFEDGCDYIAWHDIDMIPRGRSADYSYPEKYPTHIATNLTKFNNGMRYEQYFGGVVLFTKEQVYKVNGYSNEYWDWGQEDDDLFYRCQLENYVDVKKLISYDNFKIAEFDGTSSFIEIKLSDELYKILRNDHTVSILCKPSHNLEKNNIYLIGDKNKKFIEYPILKISDEESYKISFNNSNAISFKFADILGNVYYNWAKRNSDLWTWITISYNSSENSMYCLVNDEVILNYNEIKTNMPIEFKTKLKKFKKNKFFVIGENDNLFFKGKIAVVRIYDQFLFDIKGSNPTYYWDLNTTPGDNMDVKLNSVIEKIENIEIIKSVLPYRREGKFTCLEHKDEGFSNGEWIKKNTTSKNEKRFVLEMQNGKIDYKKDGINSMNYELVSVDTIFQKHKMINVKTYYGG